MEATTGDVHHDTPQKDDEADHDKLIWLFCCLVVAAAVAGLIGEVTR